MGLLVILLFFWTLSIEPAGANYKERTATDKNIHLRIGREAVEDVEEFAYLGETVAKDGGGSEVIKKFLLNKARRSFYNLMKILEEDQNKITQNSIKANNNAWT